MPANRSRGTGLGQSVRVTDLDYDPYPTFELLREQEPITWIAALGMWYVVSYDGVQTILRDDANFLTGGPDSLIEDTFGELMLTAEDDRHARFRNAFKGAFAPGRVRAAMEASVAQIVTRLIDSFSGSGCADLRAALASRLPVLAILRLFGIPDAEEANVRRWYDEFEVALANFARDQAVRARAQSSVQQFHDLIQHHIDRARRSPAGDLLSETVHAPEPLSDDEIRRNASIIFFGGISTVESLILNTMYALVTQAGLLQQVSSNPALIPNVIEETMRWLSPVQSATRHVARQVRVGNVVFEPGETVNCMLGAANRDPSVFDHPDVFDIHRPNIKRHVGFAVGRHFCLGSHLARLEARIAIGQLLERLPKLGLDAGRPVEVGGYEFRQPRALHLVWNMPA